MLETPIRRLCRLVKQIGKFDDVCVSLFDPTAAIVTVGVRDGHDWATFELNALDLRVSDDHWLGILLENRLDGIREWAYWDRRELEQVIV